MYRHRVLCNFLLFSLCNVALSSPENLHTHFDASSDENGRILHARQASVSNGTFRGDIEQPSTESHVTTQANEIEAKKDRENDTVPISDIGESFSNFSEDASMNHKYYISYFIQNPKDAQKLWVEFGSIPAEAHETLSHSYRRASTVPLSFDFPFYGHLIRNVTIATGGFLYTGPYVHQWLAATQYIAPLMGNFDTNSSNMSVIQHYDNGTAFTVLWKNVGISGNRSLGNFTFQTTLLSNGDIIFVYKNIPVPIMNLSEDHHPVKVGISDAYIVEKTAFEFRRKTIYEYHRIDKKGAYVSNWTALYFAALPTCVNFHNCTACLSANVSFKCVWCPAIERCSAGTDRHYQEWNVNKCYVNGVNETGLCDSGVTTNTSIVNLTTTSELPASVPSSTSNKETKTDRPKVMVTGPIKHEPWANVSATSIICILLIVVLLLASTLWVVYAYRYPHTPSGQFLIRWRPSQWQWRRDAGYSAASSFHM